MTAQGTDSRARPAQAEGPRATGMVVTRAQVVAVGRRSRRRGCSAERGGGGRGGGRGVARLLRLPARPSWAAAAAPHQPGISLGLVTFSSQGGHTVPAPQFWGHRPRPQVGLTRGSLGWLGTAPGPRLGTPWGGEGVGGRREGCRDWQPARSPCHPQKVGEAMGG